MTPATTAPFLAAALVVMTGLRLVSGRSSRRRVDPVDDSGVLTSLENSRLGRLTEVAARLRNQRASTLVRPHAVAAWVDDLARSVRRGQTLRDVVTTTLPDDPVLLASTRTLRHRLERGSSVVDACELWGDGLAEHRTARHAITAASVIGVAARAGGGAGQPLDRLAAAMRQFAADDLEREAQSAQARLSARVLTLVPVAVLALLAATDDDVRTTIASPTGVTVVGSGLALNAVGSWWMRRIIARSAE